VSGEHLLQAGWTAGWRWGAYPLTFHPWHCRIHFVNLVYNSTSDGLGVLGVAAYNLDRPRTAMIATSCLYLFWIVVVFLLCFARSFIEAAHDATGMAAQVVALHGLCSSNSCITAGDHTCTQHRDNMLKPPRTDMTSLVMCPACRFIRCR
jgi:hypothetical protein